MTEAADSRRWAVFFDLEGTLIVRATRLEEVVETVLFAHHRVRSSDAVRQAVERTLAETPEGEVSPPRRELYARVFRHLALEPDAERLASAVWEACQRIDPPVLASGTPAALELLRGAGAVLGVITNADGGVRDALTRLGVAGYFEVVMTPSRAGGATKPSRRIFEAALAEAGVPASRAWHVGDDPVGDVRGAADSGLSPVLVRGPRAQALDGFPAVARIDEAAALILKKETEKAR